jgi:hypothetical protein
MMGFEYPTSPHARRHGPAGYKDYSSYRDWLRDEFTFRCVYCLHREQWTSRGATFHVEHFIPASVDPDGEREYSNLLYACTTCNQTKEAILGLPNPCLAGVYCEWRQSKNAETAKALLLNLVGCGLSLRTCITPLRVGNTTLIEANAFKT